MEETEGVRIKTSDAYLNAVLNVRPDQPVPLKREFPQITEPHREAQRIKTQRYRSLGDVCFGFCSAVGGVMTLLFSPALMESIESIGAGDLEWTPPAAGLFLLAVGAKLLRGSK